jgi:hypothetical protein
MLYGLYSLYIRERQNPFAVLPILQRPWQRRVLRKYTGKSESCCQEATGLKDLRETSFAVHNSTNSLSAQVALYIDA